MTLRSAPDRPGYAHVPLLGRRKVASKFSRGLVQSVATAKIDRRNRRISNGVQPWGD